MKSSLRQGSQSVQKAISCQNSVETDRTAFLQKLAYSQIKCIDHAPAQMHRLHQAVIRIGHRTPEIIPHGYTVIKGTARFNIIRQKDHGLKTLIPS